jgi:hypothetical protein
LAPVASSVEDESLSSAKSGPSAVTATSESPEPIAEISLLKAPESSSLDFSSREMNETAGFAPNVF